MVILTIMWRKDFDMFLIENEGQGCCWPLVWPTGKDFLKNSTKIISVMKQA